MSAYVARTDQEKMSLSIARVIGIFTGFAGAALTNAMRDDGMPLWAILFGGVVLVSLSLGAEIVIRVWLDVRAENGEHQ